MIKIHSSSPLMHQMGQRNGEKRISSFRGRIVCVLNDTMSNLYRLIKRLIKSILFLHEKASDKKFSYKKKSSNEIAQQIQKYEQLYQIEENALNYILGFKLKQTISLISNHLHQFKLIVNTPDFEILLIKEKLDSFFSEMQKLMLFLNSEVEGLDEGLNHQKLDEHKIKIFSNIKAFHQLIINMQAVLPWKSPERKQFSKLNKAFANLTIREIRKYKAPYSSDTYIRSLQETKIEAWNILQKLKQSQINIQIKEGWAGSLEETSA